MALAVPHAGTTRGLEFAGTYLVLRILLWLLTFPDWRGVRRNPYTLSIIVTSPLLVVGALFDGAPRMVLWAIAAAAELAGCGSCAGNWPGSGSTPAT